MPKLTPEQRAELEAQLAADDEDDGDDDEVEYGNPDGTYWRGKVRHAKRLGLYKIPEPPKADPGKTGEGGTVRSARFGGGGAAGQRRTS